MNFMIGSVRNDLTSSDMHFRLNACRANSQKVIGKFMFVVYQLFVSLMQLNLLIAAMTRTYELIFRTDREPKRQALSFLILSYS